MVCSCCAHNCTARDVKETREAGVTFYIIPQNKAKRELWLNAVFIVGFWNWEGILVFGGSRCIDFLHNDEWIMPT